MLRNKVLVLSLATFFMIAVFAASACQPPSPSRSDGSSSSSTTSQRHDRGKIHFYVSMERADYIGSGSFRDEPEEGKVYVIADIRIVNESNGEFNTNPFKFALVADNVQYDKAFTSQLDNSLDNVKLMPGGETTGRLAFEIPANAQNISMMFEPYFDEDFEYIWH